MKHKNLNKVYKIVLDIITKYNISSNKRSFNEVIALFNNKFNINIEFNEKDNSKTIDANYIFILVKNALVKKHFTEEKCFLDSFSIQPVFNKDNKYPLSSYQKRIFVLNRIDPESYLYNISVILKPEGSIDIRQLKKALNFLATRQIILRTKFKESNGELVQIVRDKFILKLQVQNIISTGNRNKDKIDREALIKKFIKIPFNLEKEFPIRIVLLRGNKQDILLIVAHHIIIDQWSIQILIKELFIIYKFYLKNQEPKLPKLLIQYKDYAVWEQSDDNQKRLEKQKEYWLSRLGNNPSVTSLPLDYTRESILEYKKGYIFDFLDNKIIKRLEGVANEYNSSMFMVFFAIFNIYISKLTGKDDVIIGTSSTHRDVPRLSDLIGYFSNDIAVRTKLRDRINFKELLLQVRKNILRDHENSEYPLEKLINDLSFSRNVRNIRLFNTILRINEYCKDYLSPKNNKATNHAPNNDWGITFEIYKDKTRVSSEYNANVLREETVRSWVSDLIHLIKQVAKDPEEKINNYETVSPENRKRLLKEFNSNTKKQSLVKAPHHYFENQAKKTPKRVAAIYDNKKISYEKLNKEANRLANYLDDKNIKKGETIAVGIDEENYLEIPKIVLAIHKVGAACLMINRDHPEDRIKHILNKSKARFIITDKSSRKSSARGGSAQTLNKLWMAEKSIKSKVFNIRNKKELEKYNTKPPRGKGIQGKDTAFIIFTSGTTGVPKGIKVSARALVNESYYKIRDMGSEKINMIPVNFLLQVTASIEYICASFVLGKKLLIYSKQEIHDPYAVMKKAEENNLTYIGMTPSVLNSYLEIIEDDSGVKEKIALKKLKTIDLMGEKTYSGLAKRFYSHYPHITLNIEYGSSECLSCAYGFIPKGTKSGVLRKIKEGKAVRNQQVYILDKDQKLLPINAIGEIYCSGYGLFNGYIANKKENKNKLLAHPFIKGEKVYRSGDKGRIDIEGNLEVKGRVDDQVQIRGQRVELDEIREVVKMMPEIQEVLIQVRKVKDKYESDLVCYYTARDTSTSSVHSNIIVQKIKSALEKQVPKYMIPSYFMELDKFSLNQNGKIDRNKLPKPKEKDLVKDKYIAPNTKTEKQIVKIWQEVLGVKKIGLDDNFFDIGGNSLKIIQVASKLEKLYAKEINVAKLFAYSTIADLSKFLNMKAVTKKRKLKKEKIKEVFNKIEKGQLSYEEASDIIKSL